MTPAVPKGCASSTRRWRFVIYSVALTLPLIGMAETVALAFFGSVPPAGKGAVLKDMPMWIFVYPLQVVVFNWPFYVLSRIIIARVHARWPNVSSLHWAGAGALIGLSIPYIYGFSVISPYEMTSGARDAGQGVSIFLAALAPIAGGALALIGWFSGLGASRLLCSVNESA